MPWCRVNLSEKEDKQIKIFMLKNDIKNKDSAIKKVIGKLNLKI